MADDKTNVGAQDRARIAGEEPYEVAYFAEKHGLSSAQAREIISLAGNSRDKADKLATNARAK